MSEEVMLYHESQVLPSGCGVSGYGQGLRQHVVDALSYASQEAALCGVHAINTLLQGPFFSEIDLAQVGAPSLAKLRHLPFARPIEQPGLGWSDGSHSCRGRAGVVLWPNIS